MLRKKVKTIIFTFIFILAFTGCSSHREYSIVNTAELSQMMHKEEANNHKMIKLKNGVIVYTDSNANTVPKSYKQHNFSYSTVDFGPGEIKFEPANINIQKN